MPYLRLVPDTLLALLVFMAIVLGNPLIETTLTAINPAGELASWVKTTFFCLLGGTIYFPIQWLRKRAHNWTEKVTQQNSTHWVKHIELLSARYRYSGVIALSALTLFLELVLINWQASLFPVFALYKNFTLLSCFFGLGVGYALAHKKPLTLTLALPVLSFLLLALSFLRYTDNLLLKQALFVLPMREEASMFTMTCAYLDPMAHFIASLPVYLLLAGTFLLNTLLMIPMAQMCGYLMDRCPSVLGSYGCNLLGSMLGVALLYILSCFWAGPVIWFGACIVLLLFFLGRAPRARRTTLLAVTICLGTLAWPFEPTNLKIYSPYQLIQAATHKNGLMRVLSAGSYYQQVHDFSKPKELDSEEQKDIRSYYDLPFTAAPLLRNVLIVGAGTGNDIAAALRKGAQSIDAVEIDPALMALGKANHPEAPYLNPRVHGIIDDARGFFRSTDKKYDAIVYGVLDAHILLSRGTNIRLDSYVYTQEGFHEAFARLEEGGLLSVSFALPERYMGKKILAMLTNLNGAGKPIALHTGYDNTSTATFLVRKGGEVVLDADFMASSGFKENTEHFVAAPEEQLEIPVDDWPFFYMESRMYPSSYLISIVMMLALSIITARHLMRDWKWSPSHVPFFFLGAGFMLLETKAITELGLVFGNTWHVIGIVIMGVLVMAFLANALIHAMPLRKMTAPYFLLFAAILIGFFISTSTSLPLNGWQLKIGQTLLLVCPLFFSGLVFSTLLKRTQDIPSALAFNIIGAMVGGVVEYNAMKHGFASLYLYALGLYVAAYIATILPQKTGAR